MEENKELLEEKEVLDGPLSEDDIVPQAPDSELTKKEKKIKKKYFFDKDIKYRGPLSYRYLRLIAWISIAMAEVLVLNNLSGSILEAPVIGPKAEYALILVASLSVPLFIIATFATILNKGKSIKSVLMTYAVAYFALALAIVFLYYRYINDVLVKAGLEHEALNEFRVGIGNKLQVNVFADLLALSLFYFFMTYQPKRFFKDKVLLFRWLSVVPLLIAIASYLIKAFARLDFYQLPVGLTPFLTTKSPLIYVLFVILVFWLKHRERKFIKFGGTSEGLKIFEESNRNSLAFSIFISIICLVISAVDTVAYLVPMIATQGVAEPYLYAFNIGDCSGLFIAIPILILFSYSRKHKPSSADLLITLAGLGIIALSVIEMIYEIILRFLAQGA